MTGMNTLGSTGISEYQNRTVTIEVSGIRQQSVMKTSCYQTRVPYSQLSQTLQTINRQGGKVESVQFMGSTPAGQTSKADGRFDDRADAGSAADASDSKAQKSARRSKQRQR